MLKVVTPLYETPTLKLGSRRARPIATDGEDWIFFGLDSIPTFHGFITKDYTIYHLTWKFKSVHMLSEIMSQWLVMKSGLNVDSNADEIKQLIEQCTDNGKVASVEILSRTDKRSIKRVYTKLSQRYPLDKLADGANIDWVAEWTHQKRTPTDDQPTSNTQPSADQERIDMATKKATTTTNTATKSDATPTPADELTGDIIHVVTNNNTPVMAFYDKDRATDLVESINLLNKTLGQEAELTIHDILLRA